MKYGYFDQENREYIITRPDTPTPWVNYLGSPAYGGIISNHAGGYSFVKSGAKGRILRYRFNSDDKPGRYIYLRDDDNGDFWSASWQPVAKTDGYENRCRHGLGYTTMETEYTGIESETTYYVPLDQAYEVWTIKVKNHSQRERRISIFGYAEFTSENDYEQDSVNLQYSQFITRTTFHDNKIIQKISQNIDQHIPRFFGLAGAEVKSYSGDKQSFIGNYHTYANPKAVMAGDCGNQLNYNLNSCGALHTGFTLQPGQHRQIQFVLGQADEWVAEEILSRYQDSTEMVCQTDKDLEELKVYWNANLAGFKVETPDEQFNTMVNTWNAYQCFITFTWSRAASLIYCGQRNGFGYRDTVQDIQGIIHLAPELAKKQLQFMLSAQVDNGAGLPLVKYSHTPGKEDTPDDFTYRQETGHTSYRADDALWLFPTIKKYIAETGETEFLDDIIPYANKGQDSVYDHLKKAIQFSVDRLGSNRLPAGLHADWNDCLRLGENGESSFVAMQLLLALHIMQDFATLRQDHEYSDYLVSFQTDLADRIDKVCFEDDRYIRGITDQNLIIGSRQSQEASLWLNPQSWAVISGLADNDRGEKVLDLVYQELNTAYGAKLMRPPFQQAGFPGALAIVYNSSTKENGSVFLQTQGWLILAEALLGRGNRAYQYYKESSPAHQNDIPDIRQMEPYVYGQFTESSDSPNEGRSHVHWLTGTASTVMVGCVEGILGIRPAHDGILISPSIPSHWEEVRIEKLFRGKKLTIVIKNDSGSESGYKQVYLNDKRLKNNYILYDELLETNKILYIM